MSMRGDKYGRDYRTLSRRLFLDHGQPVGSNAVDLPAEGIRIWGSTIAGKGNAVMIAGYLKGVGYRGEQAGLLFYENGDLFINPAGWRSRFAADHLNEFMPAEATVDWSSEHYMGLLIFDPERPGSRSKARRIDLPAPRGSRHGSGPAHVEVWQYIEQTPLTGSDYSEDPL